VRAEIYDSWWLDTGKKDDVLSANAKILDELIQREIRGKVVDSAVEGRVRIEDGAQVINSVVRGPCVIGKNCLVKDSFIGPYTSVCDGAQVINSSIEYCVVLENALIKDVERLEESLIGRKAKVIKNNRRKVLRLHVGDYSEVEI